MSGDALESIPPRLRGPEWQRTNTGKVLSLFLSVIRSGPGHAIPPWMFGQTVLGRRNIGLVFRYYVRTWGVTMTEREGFVDPQLKRERQADLLASINGARNWDMVLRASKLKAGFVTHYADSVLEAFLANYPWAFHNPQVRDHLHYTDFPQRGLFDDVSESGKAWHFADHLLREDLQVVRVVGENVVLDRSLLPAERNAWAQSLGYRNYSELLTRSDLGTLIKTCPAASGTLEGLLFWRYSNAFSPHNPQHVNHWEMRTGRRFPDILAKKEALIHVAEENGIPLGEVHYRLLPRMLAAAGAPDLLEEGQSVKDLFAACFYEEIDRGQFNPRRFFTWVEYVDGVSRFSVNGETFSFAQDLRGCLSRQEGDKVVVYRRVTRRYAGAAVFFGDDGPPNYEPAFYVDLSDGRRSLKAFVSPT